MAYLVTGASGAVGSHIVAELASQGLSVHTFTRKPLADPVPDNVKSFLGDLTAQTFPSDLFNDVEKVFLFPAEGNMDSFLKEAKLRGIKQVVLLSSLAAALEFPRDQNSVSAQHHLTIERSVIDSGLEFTILRSGTFANNLRQWAATIKTQGMVFGPYPESAQALIHEADIADVAVAALTSAAHVGAIYPLTGPEALTQLEQLQIIGNAIGKKLTYQKITPEQFRQSMLRFVPEDIVTMLLDYWSDTEQTPDLVRNTVEEVTKKPARKLAQWAIDHAGDFS